MNNYNTLVYQTKRKILNFSEKISKGLSRPKFKFISQIFYGLLESNSIHLTNISRTLKEDISLKKTIERLSRNLSSFNEHDKIYENYITGIKSSIKEDTIFCIDLSEITKKREGTKFESLCKLRDGSTGKIENGYYLYEIAALTKNKKSPIPVYTELYSSTRKGFLSSNTEIFKGLKKISENFGNVGIKALDRGFDDNKFYEYFIEAEEDFVVRAKINRNVIYKGKSKNILTVANKFKGKYKLNLKSKNGKNLDVKISYIPIQLPCKKEKNLTLVVVYGIGKIPMMLITNMVSSDKRIAVTVTKVYLLRWRIEEYFKFKKQQFNLEDIRVRSFNSIKTLNLLLTFVIGFIGLFSEKVEENLFAIEVIENSKRIYTNKVKFFYYQIANGFFNILKKTNVGITKFLEKNRKEAQTKKLFQLSIFNASFEFCA